jgi:hypothetical protein
LRVQPLAVVLVGMLWITAGPASATPTYSLTGSHSVSIVQSTPIDYDATTVCTSGSCTSIDMLAAPGVVESGVSRAVYDNCCGGEVNFNISFEVTDLVFSDTSESGATTTSVAAVIDFSWLEGYFETSGFSPGIDLTVNASYQAGGHGVPLPHDTVGQSGQLLFPTYNDVALGVEHTFGIQIHWETGNVGPAGNSVSGLVRAWLADIPFILDEGITANSAELNVVNNTYSLVPEPSTLVLVLSGLAALARRR